MRERLSSLKIEQSQVISDAVSDSVMYSALVELLETVGCLCDDHEMRFLPRKVLNPLVEHRV